MICGCLSNLNQAIFLSEPDQCIDLIQFCLKQHASRTFSTLVLMLTVTWCDSAGGSGLLVSCIILVLVQTLNAGTLYKTTRQVLQKNSHHLLTESCFPKVSLDNDQEHLHSFSSTLKGIETNSFCPGYQLMKYSSGILWCIKFSTILDGILNHKIIGGASKFILDQKISPVSFFWKSLNV